MDDVRGSTIDPATRRIHEHDPQEEARWIAENKAAIDAFNRWDERQGSPLDRYRDA